jgi:hypothetical protein
VQIRVLSPSNPAPDKLSKNNAEYCIFLLTCHPTSITLHCMMVSKQGQMRTTSLRTSPEDRRILVALCKKLGGNATSIVRQALRVLAAKEGVAV